MILRKEVSESTRLEKLPEGKTALAHGFDEATIVGLKAPGVKEFYLLVLQICFTFYLNSDGTQ